MAATADDRAAAKVAVGYAKEFIDALLGDDAIRRWVAAEFVDELVRNGHLVPRDRLTAVEGLELVPRGTLTAARAELDELRVVVAEHLDGSDRSGRLRELLEAATALDIPFTVPPAPVPELPEKKKRPARTPEPEPEPPVAETPEREAARRGTCPPPGTPCEDCGGPIPGEGDRPDQLELSYARWREALCGACHQGRRKKAS